MNGGKFNHFTFFGDIILMSDSTEELQDMITDLNIHSQAVGLTITISKTNVLTIVPNNTIIESAVSN